MRTPMVDYHGGPTITATPWIPFAPPRAPVFRPTSSMQWHSFVMRHPQTCMWERIPTRIYFASHVILNEMGTTSGFPKSTMCHQAIQPEHIFIRHHMPWSEHQVPLTRGSLQGPCVCRRFDFTMLAIARMGRNPFTNHWSRIGAFDSKKKQRERNSGLSTMNCSEMLRWAQFGH